MTKRTGKLPGDFETRYKSNNLKNQIEDEGMWGMIPSVTYSINSPGGIERLEKNHLLFAFIDEYFGDEDFAFEPNMMDDRYVFLPAKVDHQGIGIAIAPDVPGFLEVAHFWYPDEFTKKPIPFGPSQVYIPNFKIKPGPELAKMVRDVYLDDDKSSDTNYCTFPFTPDIVVTMSGNFMDNIDKSAKTIRDALKSADPATKRNGEGLIEFMQRITR